MLQNLFVHPPLSQLYFAGNAATWTRWSFQLPGVLCFPASILEILDMLSSAILNQPSKFEVI